MPRLRLLSLPRTAIIAWEVPIDWICNLLAFNSDWLEFTSNRNNFLGDCLSWMLSFWLDFWFTDLTGVCNTISLEKLYFIADPKIHGVWDICVSSAKNLVSSFK